MDLQIKGQKYLNSNWYQSIKIKNIQRNLDKGLIEVKRKDGVVNTMPLSMPKFMDTIKNLSEIEKIKEVIEYFARNNTIFSLTEGNGVHFLSTSDRTLDIEMGFSSENQDYIKKSISKLIYNYLDTRLKLIEGCQPCSFEIIGDERQSYYQVFEDLDSSNRTAWLYLLWKPDTENLYDFGKLQDFEKKFIENFVLEKIYEQGKKAIIQDNWELGKEDYWRMKKNSLNVHNYLISCGEITFHFHKISVKDLSDLTRKINAYNENLEKEESWQLKLDLGGKHYE